MMLAAALLAQPASAPATPPASWKASGMSIDADNLRLKDVLGQFAQVYDVRLSLEIKANPVLKGRFKADNGAAFLNRLAQATPFRWFVYNDTLHIVPANDNISLRLEVGDDAVADARAAMIGVGLYDERFGWGELPDTGTVIVSGPRAYVHLARDILMPDSRKADSKARRVMMFRLKYASVSDRVINARGQTETIPGVKTILTNLLFGSQGGEKLADIPAVDVDSRKRSRRASVEPGGARQVSGAVPPFLPIFNQTSGGAANAAANRGESQGAERLEPATPRASEERGRPRIEANPALNAILIYDTGDKRAMYAALIAELDVQPQQIEIEALIVDMDRSKLAEMGVEWGVRSGSVDTVVNGTAAASLGNALPVAGATLLISDAARFYARLKALEAKGEARVLATPTVLTLDNVAAVLDLSQSSYVSLVGERVADLADITAGTMLRVIPRIIREGAATRVRLEVDIEDGSLDAPSAGGAGKGANANVNVTRSTISTQAIIDSQQTLMIGGYRAERLSRDKQKVPLLGDLPLFGGLFRTESTSTSTRERLFLITPRLSGTSGVAAPAASAASIRAQAVARGRAIIAAAEGNTEAPPAPAQRQEPIQEQGREPAAPMKPLLPVPAARVPARRADAEGAVAPPPGAPPRSADTASRAASPWALIPAAVSSRSR